MAMKQTQTKLFDFSDIGLDFSAGSKNLFPDRFKKMLVLGYNAQTVSSVAVSGNQVTFTYGGAHGYVADRVLKVDSGALASINSGEFWIDSVTTNTVVFTLDDAPVSIPSGFTTRVAPLGFELVYEQPPVQVYKFKSLKEEDLYLRLCFQSAAAQRNTVVPCVGWSADLSLGVITDPLTIEATRGGTVIGGEFKWDFTSDPSSSHNNYTYSQGYSSFGRGVVVGSKYHLAFLTGLATATGHLINGFLPATVLDLMGFSGRVPVVTFGVNAGLPNNFYSDLRGKVHYAYIGDQRVNFAGNRYSAYTFNYGFGSGVNFYPAAIEGFNTSPTEPLLIYENGNSQFVGVAHGAQTLKLGTDTVAIPSTLGAQPVELVEADFGNKCLVHSMSIAAGLSGIAYFVMPIEEIKIDY